MREIELKLLLDAAEYGRLSKALGEPQERLDQRNHYYDAPDRSWRAAGYAVRLREQDGCGILTIKGDAISRAGWTERLELERALGREELQRLRAEDGALDSMARELLGARAAALSRLSVEPVAQLHNLRCLYRRGAAGVELALDASRYPDGSIEHELELEAEDATSGRREESRLRVLFAELGIRWRPGHESKLARLLQMTE